MGNSKSIEQFLNHFTAQPNKTNINNPEIDDGSVETPLVSHFPHSDNDSDDEEVLIELSEYKNAGTLRRERITIFLWDDPAYEMYDRLYFMRRSLEVLRKFHWMILRGRFNPLSHVSSPLLRNQDIWRMGIIGSKSDSRVGNGHLLEKDHEGIGLTYPQWWTICGRSLWNFLKCFDYFLVFSTSFGGFLHLASSMQLAVIVLVAALAPEFVFGFAPLESSLSQLVLVSASLGLHLVSAWVHDESAVVHLVSALVHLAIQTI
ncbi:hypothetical protein Tco_1507772 [Tanacetum coccineum]